MSPRALIVTGATGKQGGALIKSLLSTTSQPFDIYAVTRNATSSRALALASKPGVHVIRGDFSDPRAIFAQVPQPWGLFSVTNPMNAKVEEQQGKAMTEAALAAGVQHIVFTATDRGANGDTDPTYVPHFASKFAIEQHIESSCQKKSTSSSGGAGETAAATWTFLRPVAFFENMSDDFIGKGFATMWRDNEKKTKAKANGKSQDDGGLQLISTADIGRVAAEAFLQCDTPAYRNRSIALAGDSLTFDQARAIFRELTGKEIPTTFGFVGSALRWALHEQLGIMFSWFADVGFAADVRAVRARYPFVKDFRAWLREESAWKSVISGGGEK